ncbi:MAG: type II toxin-antitoxin system RelE/ParE family toxin [Bacteroidetes bacterium]|nr:type II toxin-antitoxin system RelE/ParE family toxin [Bacteroidota bacterium]
MSKYRLTHLSNQDLNEIWEYTFRKWSLKQADKYYDLLIESFNQITLEPNCGKNYDGVEPKLRGLKTGKHIVFYELIDDDTIEISRILHQSMDIKNKLKK